MQLSIPSLLRKAARRMALQHPLESIGLTYLFQVAERWQQDALDSDASIRSVRSGAELEAAMADPAATTIYVARHALPPAEVAEAARRHALAKTVFIAV